MFYGEVLIGARSLECHLTGVKRTLYQVQAFRYGPVIVVRRRRGDRGAWEMVSCHVTRKGAQESFVRRFRFERELS